MIAESLFYIEAVARGATTWVLLLATLFISGLVGLVLYAVQRQVASRTLRWLMSIAAATVTLVFSGLLLIVRGFSVPAADSSVFEARTSYVIEVRNISSPSGEALASFDISLPDAVRINEDAALDLSVVATSSILNAPFEVSLKLGKELQARAASRPCASKAAVPAEAGQVLCATGMPTGAAGAARWMVRGEKPGVSHAVFQLPQQLEALLSIHAMGWSGSISRDGAALTKYVVGPDERPWSPGQDRSGLREVPVKLTSKAPLFRGDGFEVNLQSLEATFPLRFQTTLGVSASTYETLVLVGAITSALLGSGWLWQLLTWLRQRGGSDAEHPKQNDLTTRSTRTRRKRRAG